MKKIIQFIKHDNRREIFLIILILILSLFPRLWKLTTHPSVIVDEPANLRDINKLINFNTFHPIDYEWGFGQATLVFYPTIALIKLGIEDQFFSLRLTSIILSIIALIPFFYIVKKNTNTLIALCTTLLFSFSYYYLQFSRVGWTNIHALTIGLYFIFFIHLMAEKKFTIPWIIISGIFGGLLLYTYRAGELFLVAGIGLFLIKLYKSKEKFSKKTLYFFIFFLALFLTSYPWLNKIFSNWELYDLRASVVSIKNVQLPYHGFYRFNDIINYQIISTIKSWIFFIPIDGNAGNIENTRYLPLKYSSISPILIPLFLAGLIIALKSWKKNYVWIFLFISGLLMGQIMTVDPPNGSRAIIILPIIYLFIALSLNFIYQKFINLPFIKLFIISFSIIVAITDFLYYQYWMTWIKV